jgi:large subunit ribosomal protein L20
MPRVKAGPYRARRHKEVLKATRGYRMSIGRRYKVSKEAMLHAGQYAYIGRRLRKRDMRKLWIQRINAGLTIAEGPSYSVFINLLKQHNIELNRKMLAHLAANDAEGFNSVIKKVYGK